MAFDVAALGDGLGKFPKGLDEVRVVAYAGRIHSCTEAVSELRIAQAQLVGWLEGLFHGIQATLVAQQMAARAQLEEMRRKGLPAGDQPEPGRPGTYL